MSHVIVHDGARSIGGNKIEIRDGETRILLDFGMNLGASERFFAYDEDLGPGPKTFEAALALGLLPSTASFGADSYGGSSPPGAATPSLPRVAAVFLSHAHEDHVGCVPYLHPQIPVYVTPETRVLARSKLSSAAYRPQVFDLVEKQPVKIGRLMVDPIRVDHSMPGACAFLVTTSEGYRIAYTGDMRLHGTLESSPQTGNLLAILAERWVPHLLLTEGTNIEKYSRDVEESKTDEEDSIKGFLKLEIDLALRRGGMAFVDVSANNIDRLDTVYEIVDESDTETGLSLHVPAYNANLLHDLIATKQFDPGSLVMRLVEDAKIHVYEKKDELSKELRAKLPAERIHQLSDYGQDGSPLRKNAVMVFYGGDRKRLLDVRPPPGSAYIHSDSEAFSDEQGIDVDRLRAIVSAVGMTYHQIHASGHIYAAQLKRAIRDVDPEYVVPIHTEHPELFRNILAVREGKERCLLVENGQTIDLGTLGLRV